MATQVKKAQIGSSQVSGDKLGTVIGARVYHSVAQAVANTTIASLVFDSERWDTDNIHSTVSNTSRLTCRTAGTYLIFGNFNFTANATGVRRRAGIWLNATTDIAIQENGNNGGATVGPALNLSTIYVLAVNDYVEMNAYQNSGGNLNVEANLNWSPEFGMIRLGD